MKYVRIEDRDLWLNIGAISDLEIDEFDGNYDVIAHAGEREIYLCSFYTRAEAVAYIERLTAEE